MKPFWILFLSFLPFLLSAQEVDSIAVNQVDSLNQASFNLYVNGDYSQALETSSMAQKIALEKLGRNSRGFANSLVNQANAYSRLGQYEQAESAYLEAKDILEEILGKENTGYASCLGNLTLFYSQIGKLDQAESIAIENRTIWKKIVGKEHSNYAKSVLVLAIVNRLASRYEKAELLFLEALNIFKKTVGKEHPAYIGCLNGLSVLYVRMNQYEKAEPLILEAKGVMEKTVGKESSAYAIILNTLANLYKDMGMGRNKQAEGLYLESMALLEKTVGKEHHLYGMTLLNIADLYEIMGHYEKAERLHHESIALLEKTVGKEHPDYIKSLINLGVLYISMGQDKNAESFLRDALTISENTLGKEDPHYAISLRNLGILYTNRSQYKKAEPLLLESIAVSEKTQGKRHSDYVRNLNSLAILYLAMNQYDTAETYFTQLSSTNIAIIEKALHHLSEQEMSNYLKTFSTSQDQILSFTQMVESENLPSICYDNSLFYKGFLLQSTGRLKQLALKDKNTSAKFNLLKSYHRRLAMQYSLPIVERDNDQVTQLENQANEIEKDIASTVAGWGQAKQQVSWKEVQATLQTGEAAIEFVHYRYFDKEETDSTRYAALLLLPGNEQPQFLPLFEEKQLDNLLQTNGGRKADYVNTLYTAADRGARPINEQQLSLYELIWQPMEKKLENVKTIYFSPSGLLHRINLSAIHINDEHVLGDRYQLLRLNSTRQLVFPNQMKNTEQNALLYGGIEYEMDSTAIAVANQGFATDLFATRGEVSFTYADTNSRGSTWNYLPWTTKEVTKVETTLTNAGFHIEARKGYTATEESFKSIGQAGSSPHILHLATHGFFFPDPVAAVKEQLSIGNDEPIFKMSDHPMIRSGLILAGGNHAWQTGQSVQPNIEDGVLTAYEISQVNLSNTELVVLSACETGLGDIKGNEGVYGLQRAFKIAGAKYIIMSLWQIPDKETAYFMELFYKNMMEKEMAIPEAFQATQQELRQNPFITPYQWAGFVLVE